MKLPVSLCLFGFLRLLRSELGDFNLDGLVDAGFELWAITDHKEELEPNKQRREKNGLKEVI